MTARANRFAAALDISFWLSVLSGEKYGFGYDLLRAVLGFFAACYSVGLAFYLAAERIGLRKRAMLPVPVISIGNITSGGTGKTPFTQLISPGLLRSGMQPVVLSRGHGGKLSRTNAQVSDADGNLLVSASDAGDEATALALLLPGVPVFVGKDRVASGRLALERFSPQAFVLDDGFQFWQLKRNLDIVLVDSRSPFDNGYPIPRGALREPKRNLRRAGIVVVTRSNFADERQLQALESEIRRLAPKAPVFRAEHCVTRLRPLNTLAEALESPMQPIAVCGIAQPSAFLASLQSYGVSATSDDLVALADHARYNASDLAAIRSKLRERNADSLIVTQKDAVKIKPADFNIPLYSAELAIKVHDIDRFWEQVWKLAGLPARDISTTILA